MAVTRAELAKQGFEPRCIGMSLEGIGELISTEKNAEEIRIYREDELKFKFGGIPNPNSYYFFTRK